MLGKPVLYRSADPLDALEIAVFTHGGELGWHFDNSEFSVTVMYAESEAGGHFDYYPRLRGEDDENYPGVRKVLLGDQGGVIRLPSAPGTLAVFRGQARPAPGHPGQRAAAADQLGADLRRAPGHEAEPTHSGALLRPHRLRLTAGPH